jgi:hypothetical protein
MDMRRYAGGVFVRVEDIHESGPKRVKIEGVEDGRFEKPVLVLSDGTSLTSNQTNVRTLMRVWGPNSTDWVGQEIELYIGQTTYDGRPQDSVLVKPISPPIRLDERKPLKPARPMPKPPIDDDVAF